MSVPGVVQTDLVVIEPGISFRCLEAFLDGPPGAGDADELTGGFATRVVAVVEGELAVVYRPAA